MAPRSIKDFFSFRTLFSLLLIFGMVSCKSTENIKHNAGTKDRSDLEELYWERVNSNRMDFSEADVHFMTNMIAHHAQALIISRLAPENGASEQIRTLAARIINSQSDEINTMQRWLRDRGQPVPEVHIEGLNLMIHGAGEGHMDHSEMPGMLSEEQLRQLAEAKGAEFDRLFLKYMIEHHKGAIVMVKKLFGTDNGARGAAAFQLASGIQADQKTEIARMNRMLNHLTHSN